MAVLQLLLQMQLKDLIGTETYKGDFFKCLSTIKQNKAVGPDDNLNQTYNWLLMEVNVWCDRLEYLK
jgi:hypothetical protein